MIEVVKDHSIAQLPQREDWLVNLSHHVRHGAMITRGYVEMMLNHLDDGVLSQQAVPEGVEDEQGTLLDIFQKILESQERICRALETLEQGCDEQPNRHQRFYTSPLSRKERFKKVVSL